MIDNSDYCGPTTGANGGASNGGGSSKLNKAYLRKLDRKFDRLFKGKLSCGRLTNTSKSVYSFEGEVLSEEDDEYNSDSSLETKELKSTTNIVEDDMDYAEEEVVDELKSCFEDEKSNEDQFSSVSGLDF